VLAKHERKGMQSDRVRWILGPEAEVALVKRIFQMYVTPRTSMTDVVRMLAREGHVAREGNPFTLHMVSSLLRSEAVTGWLVGGRRATTEKGKRLGPPERVVRADASVPAIVSRELWQRVQVKIARRATMVKDKELLLADLRRALQKEPALTWFDLARLGCATKTAYANAFGGLKQAYALVGRDLAVARAAYVQDRQRTREVANAMQSDIAALARAHGVQVDEVSYRRMLHVSGVRVGLKLIWRVPSIDGLRWFDRKDKPRLTYDHVILARMLDDCTAVDFFLVRAEDYSRFPTWLSLKHPRSIDHLRCATGIELVDRIRALRLAMTPTHGS
jgi:hypothetical protein